MTHRAPWDYDRHPEAEPLDVWERKYGAVCPLCGTIGMKMFMPDLITPAVQCLPCGKVVQLTINDDVTLELALHGGV